MHVRRREFAQLVFGLFCIGASLRSAIALDPTKAMTQYVHTVWRTDEGLPENSVNRILETRDGYLWVGTQAGIARFDGVRFTVFDHTNTSALHDDYIDDLAEDSQGTLWIATSNGGVTSFRNGVFSHLDGIGARAGLTLAADGDGSIWIGGYGGVVHVRNGKVVKSYTTSAGLSGDPVRRLVVDKDRSVWIATPGGLNHLVGDRMETYSNKDGLPSNDVTNIYLGADGALWVQTQSSSIVRRVQGHFQPLSLQKVSSPTIDILQDHDGNLWLASVTEGLFRVHGNQISHFTTKDGLSSDVVSALYEDRDGNIWVGTNEGGLDRFHDGSFTTYAKEEGLAADQTYSVIEDHVGDIWITTVAGVERLHGSDAHLFTTADGLPANSAWSLWQDHQKQLWVGTSSGGLARMDDGRFVPGFPSQQAVPSYMVTGIIEDGANRFWVSTRGGGVLSYANGTSQSYSKAAGLLSNFIYATAADRKGTIWVGTSSGLNSILDGRIKAYETDGLSSATALTLHVDARNILWIGTFGRGLFRFENGRFTRYTTHQGLPDDTINNILEDADANLWIGSNKGIFRITRHDLDAVAKGSEKAVRPILFGKADGMKSGETNAGSQPSGWRARDGRLWFPTIRGVVVVDPKRIVLSNRPRPARVEQLLADDRNIDLAGPVRLVPGTRRLEIRYTAPNLSSPERTRFRYRLDGFDEQWVSGTAQRVAQYTNLPPGHYNFHVGASADTGDWGDQESGLSFDVLPQFYQTWWFRLLEMLVMAMVLLAFYRLRVNWLHARAAVLEERQRIAREIHDSLAQDLSGIVFQTEAALMSMEHAPTKTSTHLVLARDLAKTSLDEARYSVLNLSSPILDRRTLLDSVSAMARQLTGGRVVELNVHSSGTVWIVSAGARHHILLVAQEAVSNAMHHGKARTVSITLVFDAHMLSIAISDDGIGFVPDADVHEHARGHGMRNMRHRSASLGATLEVVSEVGVGTRITLHIPRLGYGRRTWNRIRGSNVVRVDE
jgi:ligand-binding sensor domain-containing protein